MMNFLTKKTVAPVSITLGHVLASISNRAQSHTQVANTSIDNEERSDALTHAAMMHQFCNTLEAEAEYGLVSLEDGLDQSWVKEYISSQRMFISHGEDYGVPGVTEARLEIISILEGKAS